LRLFSWLRHLPSNFIAKHTNRRAGLNHQLQIYVRKFVPLFNSEQRIPVLQLWFDSQFKEPYQLRMPDSSQIQKMTGEHVHMADASDCNHDYPFALHFVSTDAWAKRGADTHPFNVLSNLLSDKLFDKLPTEMKDLFCHEVLVKNNDRAQDMHARENLGETVRDLTGGWVDVQYTLQPGDKKELLKCGDRGWLHRLTCVYPWAIDVLLRRPNCLMADSTFKVLGPYTLPILRAIFANESTGEARSLDGAPRVLRGVKREGSCHASRLFGA
jgi:hypothetical protein